MRLQSLLAYHDLDRRLGLAIGLGRIPQLGERCLAGGALVRANAAQLEGSPYPVLSLSAAELAALSPQLTARSGKRGDLFGDRRSPRSGPRHPAIPGRPPRRGAPSCAAPAKCTRSSFVTAG